MVFNVYLHFKITIKCNILNFNAKNLIMTDIVENQEIDRDTVTPDELERLFNTKYNLLTETAVSLNKSYLNKLSVSKSLNIAVSLVDNSIEVYQLSEAALSRVCRLSGHGKTITEVVFCPKNDNLIYTSALDGVLKLWDIRASGACVQEYKDVGDIPKTYECMDVTQNGRVLCAGSTMVEDESYLVFWDQRNPAPLGGYWNSHTDDITQVKFHKEKTEVLATGAVDGLLNVFNITEQSEDDALTYSLNVGNSVEKLSWLDGARVACITQSNDVQVWNAASGDLVHSYTRDRIARAIKRSREDECYVVDAFTADDCTELLAGSHAGNGEVLRSVTAADRRLAPAATLAGNSQLVRCCCYDAQRELLVTAGEAGRVGVWARAGSAARGRGGKLLRPPAELHASRHKPY